MLRRSGARRSNITRAPSAARAQSGIGAPNRRVLNRVLTITKCEAGAGVSRLLKGTLRVFAVSDLHTHHRENLNWVRHLSTTAHQQDVLIVAGDISDDLDDIRVTLSALRQRFAVVFFCPGNHELWVSGRQRRPAKAPMAAAAPGHQAEDADPNRSGGGDDGSASPHSPAPRHSHHQQHQRRRHYPVRDSLEKLAVVMALCEELGVWVTPAQLGRLRVVPLLAWHHKSFDKEPDIPGVPRAGPLTISDYARCVWPARMVSELQGRQRSEPYSRRHQEEQTQHRQCLCGQKPEEDSRTGRSSYSSDLPSTATSDFGEDTHDGGDGGSSSCTSDGYGADWGDGGHGSDAVAAWFDALNDVPYGWPSYSSSSSNGTISKVNCSTCNGKTTSISSSTRDGAIIDDVTADKMAPATSRQIPSVNRCWEHLPQLPRKSEEGTDMTREDFNGDIRTATFFTTNPNTTSTTATTRTITEAPQRHRGAQLGQGQQPAEASKDKRPDSICSISNGNIRKEEDESMDVISFSHFLPIQELLPEKRYLTFPNLAKAVGSTYLAERVRRLRPQMHVFGHTHFAWDMVCNDIRYVQAPLAYPSERRFRLRSLVMTSVGEPPQGCHNIDGIEGGGSSGDAIPTSMTSSSESSTSTTHCKTIPKMCTSSIHTTRDAGEGRADHEPGFGPGSKEALSSAVHPRDEEPSNMDTLAAVGASLAELRKRFNASSASRVVRASKPDSEDQPLLQPPPKQQWPTRSPGFGASEPRTARADLTGKQPSNGQAEDAHEGLTSPWPSSLDPGDSRWLPLCIYRAQYTVRLHLKEADVMGNGGGCGGGGNNMEDGECDGAVVKEGLEGASAPWGGAEKSQLPVPVAQLLIRPVTTTTTTATMAATATATITTATTTTTNTEVERGEEEEAADGRSCGDDHSGKPKVEVLQWRSQWCPEQASMWSSYYKRHARQPQELQLAPWVAERYSRRLRRSIIGQQALERGFATASTTETPLKPESRPTSTSANATLGGKPQHQSHDAGADVDNSRGTAGSLYSPLERGQAESPPSSREGNDCKNRYLKKSDGSSRVGGKGWWGWWHDDSVVVDHTPLRCASSYNSEVDVDVDGADE